MSTARRTGLHPEVQTVMQIFDELKVPDFYKGTPAQARTLFNGLRPDPSTLPDIHHCEELSIPVNHGELAVRIYRPNDSANLPVLMWFHGGGWVFGDLNASELACREMAMQAGCAIVSVDYRLAPEARFPAALEDCISAVHWVIANASKLSFDTSHLAVGGDSAGGNLAACVAQYARDQKIALAIQLLIYPVTQPTVDTPSYQKNAEGYFLSRDSMIWFWDHYVPEPGQRLDPRVSPIHGTLTDLAPTWIFTCGFDPLCDDGLLYADALQQAGVAVERYHRDDSIHGVFGMAISPGSEARSIAAQALRAALHPC